MLSTSGITLRPTMVVEWWMSLKRRLLVYVCYVMNLKVTIPTSTKKQIDNITQLVVCGKRCVFYVAHSFMA